MGNLSAGAFLVALSGIVIVFLMLAVLCLMIPVISKCVQMTQKKASPAPAAVPTPAPAAPAPAPAGAYGGEVALIDVDEKTAACIMAIVSHETGIPLSELVFKKIKAL
ncbi:MAG: OadG family transporter subunit [Butyricicoccus sp.]|nr:OadG family transporter subunit [Butyricicoccus sp.]